MYGEPVGCGCFLERIDVEEEHVNAEQSLRRPLSLRSKPLVENRPLHVMERQYLDADDEGFRSFEQRCYILFRDYVRDIELGRVSCDDREYNRALRYWEYYGAIFNGFVIECDYRGTRIVDIDRAEAIRRYLLLEDVEGEK